MTADHVRPTTTDGGNPAAPSPGAYFLPTRWTVVLAAAGSDTTQAREALAQLCQLYWCPLYAYVRRKGYAPPDAEDLTQGFFALLLEHNWVSDADRKKGRFRTFLLTALSRFLANEWDRTRAQKRGAGAVTLSLDTTLAEERYRSDPAMTMAPDRLYDRQWAMTLLGRALARLRTEHEQTGKVADFATLCPFLTAERGGIPYATVAAQLGINETAARQAVHRLRKRFREVFRDEIAQTVASPGEVAEEIRHLLAALAA
jgi:RNA polymerase sigma factor (sigma-70 family)